MNKTFLRALCKGMALGNFVGGFIVLVFLACLQTPLALMFVVSILSGAYILYAYYGEDNYG